MSKKSFILYMDLYETIKELSDAEAGTLFRAIFSYQTGEGIEKYDRMTKLMMTPIIQGFKRDEEKWMKVRDRNAKNGKKGGRPRTGPIPVISEMGKEVPLESEHHFLYLIIDSASMEFKIGETSNLINRRRSIRRPTANLDVYDFVLMDTYDAQEAEREFIEKFANCRISGDWFQFNDKEFEKAVDFFDTQKTQWVKYNPRKAVNANVTVNVDGNAKDSTTAASADAKVEEIWLSSKKRKLKGKRLEAFKLFWKSFGYAKGRAGAIDSWLDIPELTDPLVAEICKAAELEAVERPSIRAQGKTPKFAQGWITDRRWEDGPIEAVAQINGTDTDGRKRTGQYDWREENRKDAARKLEFEERSVG